MTTTRCIPRICIDDDSPILFFPDWHDDPRDPSAMMSYQRIGQHGSASVGFYLKGTRPWKPRNGELSAMVGLLAEYRRIVRDHGEPDEELKIVTRR